MEKDTEKPCIHCLYLVIRFDEMFVLKNIKCTFSNYKFVDVPLSRGLEKSQECVCLLPSAGKDRDQCGE